MLRKTNTKKWNPIFTAFILLALLIASGVSPAHAQETILKVIIVYGGAGHSAIHLERDGQQLYWDPGGFYSNEMDRCREDDNDMNCQRFAGFPWKELQQARRYDVFLDDAADLLRILTIYHLDGDEKSEVFTFRLEGDMAQRAWQLLREGAEKGRKAAFRTDRKPYFCTKSVTAYLRALGGRFSELPRPWFPSSLSKEMKNRGMTPSRVYTLNSPEIGAYIAQVRNQAGLGPLRLVKAPPAQSSDSDEEP